MISFFKICVYGITLSVIDHQIGGLAQIGLQIYDEGLAQIALQIYDEGGDLSFGEVARRLQGAETREERVKGRGDDPLVRLAFQVLSWLIQLVAVALGVVYAYFYKSKVVDKIAKLPPKSSREISWPFTLFECCNHGAICMNSVCCVECRAAHNYHVADALDFWPAFAMVIVASLLDECCCAGTCVMGFMQVRLKERRGINGDCFNECCLWCWCRCCTVGQGALAIDRDSGVTITGCLSANVSSPVGQPVQVVGQVVSNSK
eukprot:TRINITY_DN14279_c3_g1_i1.p1 TRINITY_DN14279_c3_g1~~TRINITY_DN14279_c3_g1_i1.p1  ORF type:complete len:261 (-),score=21.45 TRINITY_DN14279_c3_g1_i1:69-851(-)